MKYLILVGDGMADFPLDDKDGRTPLELAHTPAMDALARQGALGLFTPIPEGLDPGSDIGNLSLFGFDPREAFTGRAPLEAANRGIMLRDGEVAFRCNLVTLLDGRMANFTADHIATDDAAQLIDAIDAACADLPIRFVSGVSYRHLALLDAGQLRREDLPRLVCTPPHNISDQPYAPHLPQGPGADLLATIAQRAGAVLADHPLNTARIARGALPANAIWLWGHGTAPQIASYPEVYGITGAVVSAVDLVKGIGRCAGLEILDVPGATGYLDTNYAGKVAAALDALDGCDLVYLHVEAPDETAHEGRLDLKVQAIEEFDRHVVDPCLAGLRTRPAWRVLVAPDHITALSTRTHAGGPVPFALAGTGIASNGGMDYSERAAAATGLSVNPGFELISVMIREARPSFSFAPARFD